MQYLGDIVVPRDAQQFYDLNFLGYIVPMELVLLGVALLAVPTLMYASRAARASARQNELSTVPILVLDYNGESKKIELKNINGKFACNIKVETFYGEQGADVFTITLTLPGNADYLDGTQTATPLETKVRRNGESIRVNEADLVNVITDGVVASVSFVDSQGLRYFTLVEFNQKIHKIKRPPTRVTLRWRTFLLGRIFRDFVMVQFWQLRIKVRRQVAIFSAR